MLPALVLLSGNCRRLRVSVAEPERRTLQYSVILFSFFVGN
jgi:hypothetical protein